MSEKISTQDASLLLNLATQDVWVADIKGTKATDVGCKTLLALGLIEIVIEEKPSEGSQEIYMPTDEDIDYLEQAVSLAKERVRKRKPKAGGPPS